jgi:hypothetical protein
MEALMTVEKIVHRAFKGEGRESLAFGIKWVSSIIQILGYAATGFGWTPWNLYLFVIGVVGWFAVGVFWNDKAIMLIHSVALASMTVGMISQS